MIVPKKKVSIFRKHRRHSTRERLTLNKLSNATQVVSCKHCGADKLAYRVCEKCGYYRGKQVITIKSKSKSKVVDA